MRAILVLAQIACFLFLFTGAKSHQVTKSASLNPELKFLDLKFKKEISDKKLSNQKRFVLAVMAARDLKQLHYREKALEYYKIANDIKTDENKSEVLYELARMPVPYDSLFYYDVNLKQLLKSKNYEKALLSMNPEKLTDKENTPYKVLYDLLNVRLRKTAVRKLYCLDDYQKDPEEYQYSNLICDMLNDYIRTGKIAGYHIKLLEEYFFKHDLKERYLLQVVKDLKSSL